MYGAWFCFKINNNRNCIFRECLTYYDEKEIVYFYGESRDTLAIEKNCSKTLVKMADIELEEKSRYDEFTNTLEEFTKCYKSVIMNIRRDYE